MKIFIFFYFLIFITTFSFSQKVKYEVSEPYKVIDASHREYFTKNGKILGVKIEGETVYIQKWNASSLNEISRKKFKDFPKKFEFEGVKCFNDHFYFFYSLWNKKELVQRLYAREINFDLGIFKNNEKLLLKVEGKLTNAYANGIPLLGYHFIPIFYSKRKFNFETSYDQTKILIQYRKKPKEVNDDISHDVIGINIFDAEMKAISKREVKMPYTEAKMDNIGYTVDKEGNPYILALKYLHETRKPNDSKNKANYEIQLFKLPLNSKELKKETILLDSILLNQIVIFNEPGNQIICTGYYSNGGNLDRSDGIFIFKFNGKGKLADIITNEIPVSVLHHYNFKNVKKKDRETLKGELESMKIRKLITYNDGSMVLIGEQFYNVKRSAYSPNTPINTGLKTFVTYHYNDILVSKIKPNGQLDWIKKLPKRQEGRVRKGGMSFKHFQNENTHFFLFLDHSDNIDLEKDERPQTHENGLGGVFTIYTVNDSSGNINKMSLFDVKNVEGVKRNEIYQFGIDRFTQISDNEFVLEAYEKRNKDILIKVDLSSN